MVYFPFRWEIRHHARDGLHVIDQLRSVHFMKLCRMEIFEFIVLKRVYQAILRVPQRTFLAKIALFTKLLP